MLHIFEKYYETIDINAQPILEKVALLSEFPKYEAPSKYKIGIGDTITFSRLIENFVPQVKSQSMAHAKKHI